MTTTPDAGAPLSSPRLHDIPALFVRVRALEAALRPLAEYQGALVPGWQLWCTFCGVSKDGYVMSLDHAPTCSVLTARALLGMEEGHSE